MSYEVRWSPAALKVVTAHLGEFPRLAPILQAITWRLAHDPRRGAWCLNEPANSQYVVKTEEFDARTGIPFVLVAYSITDATRIVEVTKVRIWYPDKDELLEGAP